MGLIESLKAAAIRTTDLLNKFNDPFDNFTRPALPKEIKKLSEFEKEFYDDLMQNFWVCDGQVLAHRLPLPIGSPLDMGDQAIWHGVYTAMLALRFWQLRDSETSKYLYDAAQGLTLHQTIHGEPSPRLIRGISDDCKTWQDDASNDSATGHLLGIYLGWKLGPETMRPVFAKLSEGLALELLNHGDCLVGPTGLPTTYGALVDGWRSDPLRVTLALAIYAVAACTTNTFGYEKEFHAIFDKYKAILAYPKVKLWWKENYNDTHRAAIHLAILADLTQGEQRDLFRDGLARIRNMVRKDGNIWVNALCAWGLGYQNGAADDRELALKVLSEFSLEQKKFNGGVDNSIGRTTISTYGAEWSWTNVLWNGTWMADQPLPRWVVRSQDFFWQRNLRSLDVGSSGIPPDSRLNCGDWLCAYWLCRATGILTDQD